MKKVLIATIMLVVGFVMCANFTYAASSLSCKMEAIADKAEIKAGDTVKVTFKLKDVQITEEADGEGILAAMGTIKYDTSVFEEITTNSIEALNVLKPTSGGQAANMVTLTTSNGKGIKADGDLFSVTLKAKADVKAGTTKITLSGIKLSLENSKTDIADISTADIKVVATTPDPNPGQTPTPNPGQTPTPNPGQTPTPNPGQTPIPNPGQTPIPNPSNGGGNGADPGKAGGNLPNAGAETVIIPVMLVIAIIGGIAYNRYRKMKY